ncbi:hypothetical protein [Roseisolibacter sp. H3M3-2]|uniref:hypothetical protein n=1 Tax=Roseisolibacter sp. H3M3-2 TaxID=3031323 RepID=UPI0023DCB9DB|nr:hypothetical protein [Roseisolibacter sp. H3M3-2]MDF1502042.1 hypothetical protein [Roseisolibacter sp. H3M3-2]
MFATQNPALPAATRREVLSPSDVRALAPDLVAGGLDVWVYRYTHVETGWRLSVATLAAPGSGRLSLGGFRIAPESRTSQPGFDSDREAVGLAVGMEEKVYWSRVLRVGGPLVRRNLDRIVGGKCVLHPTPGSRVGEPGDVALLDFAVACLRDCDATGGILVTTGQDLGHGTLSDGATSSLAYMHARFAGSMLADTSKPTGEGNFHLLRGMLDAAGVPLARARVALVGAGNIGRHLLGRILPLGAQVRALELVPEVRERLAAHDVEAWPVERKEEFLALPFDAVVVNASGGSLDPASVAVLAANPHVRVVCGSENLAMPDQSGERTLLAAGKVYAHPELGGMMGYLTAAEESLARREGTPFDVGTLLVAAERLYAVGREATARVIAGGYRETFQEAARNL